MRLLRLRLTDYRGIDHSEVCFGPRGLTVVEGRNEAGKTSLGEAVTVLFEYPDSSKHRDVQAIKSVTRDAGAEIELEAESGPYRFTYGKRFHKKPETTLTITAPKPESLTGRDAHERAAAILCETIDVDLWKALCMQQGEAVAQADLKKQRSLSAALDQAAGGQRADPIGESLFDLVRAEYGQYYTEQGKEKKELQDSRKALEASEADVAALQSQIQSLEKDVARAADLGRELEGLRKQEQTLRSDVAAYAKALEQIKELEAVVDTARLKLESAEKTRQAAARELEHRQQLVASVVQATKEHAELDEQSRSSTASVTNAENGLQTVQAETTRAEAARKQAESLLALRRADLDYLNNKLHLDQLRERRGRIDRARNEAARAEEFLAANRVDDKALTAIQKAERALITAQAKLETGAPTVSLRGLSDLSLDIDGAPVRIGTDEVRTLNVAERVRVTIPGALEIDVTAGASSADLANRVNEAKQSLDATCTAAGVGSADAARQSHDQRREARNSLARQKEIEQENLRDLTFDELHRKVTSLERGVSEYPAARHGALRLPDNLHDAKAEMRRSEEDLAAAGKAWEEARVALEGARSVRDGLRERQQKVTIERDLKAEEVHRATDALARSRKGFADTVLESASLTANERVRVHTDGVRAGEAELRGKDPDRVKALAETAQASLATVERKREAAQKEYTEVRTRLKLCGEEGLQEQLDAGQRRRDHASREFSAMLRRAQAAGLLYATMKEERDQARRAYVAPLKEKIERLGRLVFNGSFTVELTDDLVVASRTMDGATVPFASLSGGTREQLAMISRLACAMTVSKESGASLILDDALGYSDSERLKLMGAVLAIAAKECQIIILTCVPERYSHVGEATVVRLGG